MKHKTFEFFWKIVQPQDRLFSALKNKGINACTVDEGDGESLIDFRDDGFTLIYFADIEPTELAKYLAAELNTNMTTELVENSCSRWVMYTPNNQMFFVADDEDGAPDFAHITPVQT